MLRLGSRETTSQLSLMPLDRCSEVSVGLGAEELAEAELLLEGFCSSQGMLRDVAVQLL